ncbi:Norsolorinic acid ketoreductase [Cytospora mali]|uniref:Norsolorinic acid ketoreductase n=1 Tax=Cytospora mali TaxID=578113 RepID=A0A194UN25_CYTMA|nr:Norsolorinic acid ketoreductase [Valsa mali var. pyri (nom. inval.)]
MCVIGTNDNSTRKAHQSEDQAAVNVLITGANRGLGRGFVEAYVAKPYHVVIAAIRDPEHHTSKALAEISNKGEGSRLIIVKIDATAEADAAAAVEHLTAHEGIHHLDVVIANAGIASIWPSVAELKAEDLLAHFKPNVLGIVFLYQATRQLLLKAADPKWVTIGSNAGCIELELDSLTANQAPFPNAAYGPTKSAAHWITKRINAEDEKLVSFVIHPGWAQTGIGNLGASQLGMDQAPVPVKNSVGAMVPLIEKATKEATSGRLWDYTGEQLAW